MTRTIVHIGPHKTGTTAIQGYLSENRDNLLAAGIDFPQFGRRENGAQAHRYFSHYMLGRTDNLPDGFEHAARAWRPEAPTCLLSAEGFYLGSQDECIDRLAALVPGISQIVFSFREPVSHLRSFHREHTKKSFPHSFAEFVNYHTLVMENPPKGFSFYRFQKNIQNWRRRFPVSVLQYNSNTDIVDTFSNACGLPRHLPRPAGLTMRLNASDDDIVVALRRITNLSLKLGFLDTTLRHRIFKWIAHLPMSELEERFGNRLSRQTVDVTRFLERFRNQNPDYADVSRPHTTTVVFRDFSNGLVKVIAKELAEFSQSLSRINN